MGRYVDTKSVVVCMRQTCPMLPSAETACGTCGWCVTASCSTPGCPVSTRLPARPAAALLSQSEKDACSERKRALSLWCLPRPQRSSAHPGGAAVPGTLR